MTDSHRVLPGSEPISSGWRVARRNHDPKLRDRKSHGRTRREAATRAAPHAGRRLGHPPVGGDLWDPSGEPGNSVEPVWHRRDDGGHQRRARRSSLGVRGDYAEEPDERSDRGGREKDTPGLLRGAAWDGWGGRRNPRRD